jgi:serine/threonine-protein phosphatase 5
VVRKNPADKSARLKLAECEKIVKRIEFIKAIEVEDAPLASEGLDVESMAVDSKYDGAKLGNAMTQEFIDDMIQRFKDGKQIAKKYVYQILLAVKDIVYKEPTMVEFKVEAGKQLTICGDTHGKLTSTLI